MIEENGYAYPEHATRRRRAALAVAVVIGALAVIGLVQLVGRPWIEGYFEALDELAQRDPVGAGRKVLGVVTIIAVLYGSLIAAFGLQVAYVGGRTVRARRWPYPGMRIHRRWRILVERPAVRRGRLLIVLGLSVAILGPALAWKAYSAAGAALDLVRSKRGLQPTEPSAGAEPRR